MKQTNLHFANTILIILLLGLLFPCISGFGQNKVQYQKFDWHYIKTQRFNLYFHDTSSILSAVSAKWIESIARSLEKDLSYIPKEKLPILIYNNPNLFQQTNIILETIPEEMGGFTELFKNRVVVPFNGSYSEFRHVIHHELVHAFMFSFLFDQMGAHFFSGNRVQFPLWFAEGSAEYLSTGWNSQADMFLMDRTIFGSIPLPGPELSGYLAYKGGQSFLFFLESTYGKEKFNQFLREFKRSKMVNTSIEKTYGLTLEALGEEWIHELKRLYWPEIGRRETPESNAEIVASHKKEKNNFNLKPRISPDGAKIAYFTDKEDYTKIYVKDNKGEVIAKISQSGYGGYFESFHPFRSGMCWAPSSDKLAFVTKNKGRDEIRIVDIVRKKLLQTLTFDFESISSPDWSPDGSLLVFCAIVNGKTDLFLYNFSTSQTERLTDDIFYEADPRFSPDASKIIFSAEDTSGVSPSSEERIPSLPVHNLFIIDLASRTRTQFTATSWNDRSACFSSDGNSIIFVSDRNGISNLYFAPLQALDSAKPITNYVGGCSDPDWSKNESTLVFCLFQKQGWDIWKMKNPAKKIKNRPLEPTQWALSQRDSSFKFFTKKITTTGIGADSSKKVNITGNDSIVKKTDFNTSTNSAFNDSAIVIGETNHYTQKASVAPQPDVAPTDTTSSTIEKNHTFYPYRLKFTPDLITAGISVNTLYGYAAGQLAIVLSDLMGNHRIIFAGDLEGNLNRLAHIYASYFNLEFRTDFGVGFLYSKDYASSNILGDSLYHDTNLSGMLMVSYPFSTFSRIEFNVYAQNIYRQPQAFVYDIIDRQYVIADDTSRNKQSIKIIVPSLSHVFDNILWGLTGPINGMRSNMTFTVCPPLKFLNGYFLSAEADVRHYYHISKRFVWANRLALGVSMPLKGSESVRRYFLGGTDTWLFYEINAKQYRDNADKMFFSEFVMPFRGWKLYDLSGTRVAVLNTEFRFPFIKEISLAWPLPIAIRYVNGAVFSDIGNAWDRSDQYENIPLPKTIYGGIGGGLRANLGIFVLRFDRAWQTDWRTYIGKPISYLSLGAEF